jgi:hypothetical protein
LDSGDDVVEASGDNALPLWVFVVTNHGEGLACSGLSIGEDSSVESLESVLDKTVAAGLIYLVLSGLDTEHVVENKIFYLLTLLYAQHVLFRRYTEWRSHIAFPFVERSHPQCYLHGLVLVGFHSINQV